MKADRFTVVIQMGNAAMQDRHDVAKALRGIAKRIEAGQEYGGVLDDNGNVTGSFTFKKGD